MNTLANETKTRPAPKAKQIDICYDRRYYTAFPQVVRLEGDELLIAFRQAPREERVRHTHPRSIITVMRSYDAGSTWDAVGASQLAAGGGQEFGPLYLGRGRVVGALAWHEVVPLREEKRSGFLHFYPHEYPFRTPGTYWAWSENYGLTWPPHQVSLIRPDAMPCAPPIRLADGRFLCPAYSWEPGSNLMSALFFTSRDDGRSWSDAVVMAQGSEQVGSFCEPMVIELEPGHLLALHRVEGGPAEPAACFRRNESFDGGRTWSEPVNTGILSGACPRLLKLRDGRLLLTYGRRAEPFGIRARLSDDGGRSWGETAWILRKGRNGDLGYTSSVELADGEIFTATYMQNARGTTGIVGTFWRVPS